MVAVATVNRIAAHALRRLFAPMLIALCMLCPVGMLAAADAPGREVLWRVDAERSEVQFHLRALGVVGIEGSIASVQGEIWRDAKGRWVQLRVPLQQLRMSNEKNRRWALSAEFFDAARHPLLVFTAALPDNEHVPEDVLDGTLMLRGVEAPVRVEIVPRRCADSASDCRIDARSEVSRRRFGMRSRRYVVSDKVTLALSLRLVKA